MGKAAPQDKNPNNPNGLMFPVVPVLRPPAP